MLLNAPRNSDLHVLLIVFYCFQSFLIQILITAAAFDVNSTICFCKAWPDPVEPVYYDLNERYLIEESEALENLKLNGDEANNE